MSAAEMSVMHENESDIDYYKTNWNTPPPSREYVHSHGYVISSLRLCSTVDLEHIAQISETCKRQ